MHRVSRAHPVIQVHVEALERLVKKRAHLVGVGLGRESLGERGAANLVAMLVRAAQERDGSAADVRDAVAVKNRGSYMDTMGNRNSKRPETARGVKRPAVKAVLIESCT